MVRPDGCVDAGAAVAVLAAAPEVAVALGAVLGQGLPMRVGGITGEGASVAASTGALVDGGASTLTVGGGGGGVGGDGCALGSAVSVVISAGWAGGGFDFVATKVR